MLCLKHHQYEMGDKVRPGKQEWYIKRENQVLNKLSTN